MENLEVASQSPSPFNREVAEDTFRHLTADTPGSAALIRSAWESSDREQNNLAVAILTGSANSFVDFENYEPI